MTDIIERAANAIANELLQQEPAKGGTFFVDADDLANSRVDGDFDLRHVARAVLQAIREYPSHAMLSAGGEAVCDQSGDTNVIDIWQSMIDAALSSE